MKTWTATRIRQAKGKQKISCLTAYDCTTARMVDETGIPLVMVGDSLGMTVLGYETTIPVTMEQMLHHTAAVVRGVKSALVIADMPFLSYQVSIESGIANAGRLIKEAGADAVKIEGGAFRSDLVRALVTNGIPVVGHIGLTPQSILEMGGYKIQGRTAPAAARLLADAQALAEAGIFALVLECLPSPLATEITAAVPVPTIGIGAGPGCDGQVLVSHDLLGLNEQFLPKFAKRYANLAPQMRTAFAEFAKDVTAGTFPGPEHGFDAGP